MNNRGSYVIVENKNGSIDLVEDIDICYGADSLAEILNQGIALEENQQILDVMDLPETLKSQYIAHWNDEKEAR